MERFAPPAVPARFMSRVRPLRHATRLAADGHGAQRPEIRRGAHRFVAQELERAVAEVKGVSNGKNRVAVFSSADAAPGATKLVILAETREKKQATRRQLEERIQHVAVERLGAPADDVVLAPPETLAKAAGGEFPDAWGDFKAPLSEGTRGKCGYCEVFVICGQNGDVEHFFPKSEIWKLSDDAAERGREEDWTAKVRGRKKDVISPAGFWWLAYDWENYLLSCLVCNQKWKLAYFPFKEGAPVAR